MRAPSDMPRRRRRAPGRGRVILVIAAVALFVLFTSLRGIAGFYTDYLWFDSLGRNDVWRGQLGAQLTLSVLFTAVFAVALWVNLLVADRLSPVTQPFAGEDDLVRRYRDLMGRRAGLTRALVALAAGLLAGASMSSRWEEWLLFRNGVDTGTTDELFGMDVGFYLFDLPFLSLVVDWVFASTIIIGLITAVVHYLNGGIRLKPHVERVTPQVKAHLSVIVAVLALVKAADYWLDRYELTFSTRGAVDGATYTDVNAQLPVLHLLVIIALLSCGLFLANIRRRGWVLPVVAVGLWAFVAIVAGTLYPAFIQRFQVDSARSAREAPYVERNLTATKAALGLAEVETVGFDYDGSPDNGADAVRSNTETLRNARLLDPAVIQPSFDLTQRNRGYYTLPQVDTDRYEIERPDGSGKSVTQALVSARQLDTEQIPEGWENEHLVYTHGYGFALSAANATTAEGDPEFLVGAIPVSISDDVAIDPDVRPQLYMGEDIGGYAIVGTARDEVDYDGATTRYEGSDGVPIGGLVNKMAFALRFGDWNPLVSGFVTEDSRVIYVRDIRQRAEALAPMLSFDSDPYLVAADGRLFYVLDAYTTSDRYPYGQRAATDDLDDDSGLRKPFNYVRNSVKTVIDAYDGTVTFYVMDDSDDPVLRAWAGAFPDLFTPGAEMSDELRSHLRYPEDLFRVQTTMWGRYHIEEPVAFLEQTNGWDVSQDPGNTPSPPAERTFVNTVTGEVEVLPDKRVDPYHQMVRLPGDDEPSYVQVRTFVPRSSNEGAQRLTSFMVARSDPGSDYGKLISYTMPSDQQVDGPSLVQTKILADDDVRQTLTLLNPQNQGSRVQFGDLLLLPLDDTLLWVRPLYLQSDARQSIPQLKSVIVVHGSDVAIEATLRDALAELFGVDTVETFEQTEALPGLEVDEPEDDGPDAPDEPADTTTTTRPPAGEPSDPPAGGEPSDLAGQLAVIERSLAEAEARLRTDGDLGAYQTAVRDAQVRLEAILDGLDASGAPSGAGPPDGEPPGDGATSTTTAAA